MTYAKPLPTFEEAAAASDAGTANPVEIFVYHNEPSGPDDRDFRRQLAAALSDAALTQTLYQEP